MSGLYSVSPPIPPGRSYASWAGSLAGILATLLDAPHDEFHRARARRLLREFDDECKAREAAIGEITPQSIRAELISFLEQPEVTFSGPKPPERLLRAVYDGEDVP